MRFQIEYLQDAGQEHSVCYVSRSEALDAGDAARQARARAEAAKRHYLARGFQVRDLAAQGRIVAAESFDA